MKFWIASGKPDRRTGRPLLRGAAYARLCGAEADDATGLTSDAVWRTPGAPPLPERGLVVLHPNRHLEAGRSLESWYPELPIRRHYPLRLPPGAERIAEVLLRRLPERCVAFFTGGAEYMGGQHPPEEWARLVRAVLSTWPEAGAVFLGAGDDVPHTAAVAECIPPARRLCLFDAPLPVLVAVLRRCRAFVGAAGGPGIVGSAFGLPAAMYYPEHLLRMPGTWEPPDLLAAGHYPWGPVKEMPRCREIVFPMLQRAFAPPADGRGKLPSSSSSSSVEIGAAG